MAIGFQLNDPVVLARASRRLAGGDETGDSRALEADIGLVLSDGISSGSFDPKAMRMMLDIMNRHGLEVPTPMTRALAGAAHARGDAAHDRPVVQHRPRGHRVASCPRRASSQDDGATAAREGARAGAPSLRTLPGHVEAIAAQLRGGRLSMRVERFAGADRAVVDEWVDRVIFAAIGIFGLLGSAVLLLAAAVVDGDQDFTDTLQLFGYFGLVITSVILMRTVAQLLRREADDAPDRRL